MRIVFLLILLFPSTVCGQWVLSPRTMVNGGVAVLRWQGEVPMDVAVARFNGESFFLDRDSEGPFALIGIDVLQKPGTYQVEMTGVDKSGVNHFDSIQIIVKDANRKTDYLTLPQEMVTPKKPEILKRIGSESHRLKSIFAQDSGPYIGGLFGLPVADPVSSFFGTKRVLNGEPKSPHSGTDFRSPLGRLVRAPAAGRVVFVDDLYYTGRTVILDHGSAIYSLYAHLLKPLCKVGERLDSGQPLGKVGSTGRSTGAHLHWTVKIRGAKVDPLLLLASYGKERP
ncbi:MAG: hypothetical protein C0623_03815 [Desulfuromonas sp.]|nr:MAG: hypothetical protein C0623_03815 [Desulfuromonas sp.]